MEELRAVKPRARNKHHPVGEAILGTKKFPINREEHAAFHRACGYSAPDMLSRRLVYAGLTKNAYSIPFEVAQRVLHLLTPDRWRDIYKPDTFLSLDLDTLPHRDRAALAAYHMRYFFGLEQVDIQHALGRIAGMDESNSMGNVMDFFRTTNAPNALRKLLTERAGNKQHHKFKWSETMDPSIHSEISSLVNTPHMERMTQQSRQQVYDLLLEQSDRIDHWRQTVFPTVRDFTPELARMGTGGRVIMSDFD